MQKRLFDALFLYIGAVGAQPEYCCPSEPARVNIISVIQRERQRQPSPRTRTQRSGSRPKRRSKGASEAFTAKRKRSPADFATTQSPKWFLHANDPTPQILHVILALRAGIPPLVLPW